MTEKTREASSPEEEEEGEEPRSKQTSTKLTAVGAVGELELLGQECRESSQMEEGTGENSCQLC